MGMHKKLNNKINIKLNKSNSIGLNRNVDIH